VHEVGQEEREEGDGREGNTETEHPGDDREHEEPDDHHDGLDVHGSSR
jgi:hypothetical protein